MICRHIEFTREVVIWGAHNGGVIGALTRVFPTVRAHYERAANLALTFEWRAGLVGWKIWLHGCTLWHGYTFSFFRQPAVALVRCARICIQRRTVDGREKGFLLPFAVYTGVYPRDGRFADA